MQADRSSSSSSIYNNVNAQGLRHSMIAAPALDQHQFDDAESPSAPIVNNYHHHYHQIAHQVYPTGVDTAAGKSPTLSCNYILLIMII